MARDGEGVTGPLGSGAPLWTPFCAGGFEGTVIPPYPVPNYDSHRLGEGLGPESFGTFILMLGIEADVGTHLSTPWTCANTNFLDLRLLSGPSPRILTPTVSSWQPPSMTTGPYFPPPC